MAKATDHLGQEFKSQNDMCRYWGVAPSLYIYRIKHGWTKERALTTRNERNVFDHKGNEYANTEELCRAYSISRDCFEYRIKQKWSLCDALTTPVEEKRISEKYRCRDRDGVVYASQSQMCVAHKTSRGVFNYQKQKVALIVN